MASPDATETNTDLFGIPRGLCDAPLTFADNVVPSRTLDVVAGAPEGGDGSPNAPFATIEAAARVAAPGTWIRLAAGVHASDQVVIALRGTAEAPIWITGDLTKPPPVIAGGAEALHLTRPAYVVIRHLELIGQSTSGIAVDDGGMRDDDTAAHHVFIDDVQIHDVSGNCLDIAGVNDLYVYWSQFARCRSGIDQIGSHRAVIALDLFEMMTASAVQTKGGSTDVDIRQNRINNGGERAISLGGATALELFRPPSSNTEARRIRAFDNIVTGSSITPFAFVGCVDCLVAHNLVYGTPRWLLAILDETWSQTVEATQNGRVINNSFLWESRALSTQILVGRGSKARTFTFSHNLWYATDDATRSDPTLPVSEDGSVIGEGSVYLDVPWDVHVPLERLWCVTSAEVFGAVFLPEVDGTIEGWCRGPDNGTAPKTIGPQAGTFGGCTL